MKKILYVFDDINYNSGAKKVTVFQMKEMQKKYGVYLLSLTKPKEELGFLEKDHILDERVWRSTELYATSFKKVMKSREYGLHQKILRILYAVFLRCGVGDVFFEQIVRKVLSSTMETFDDVIVVSEASKLRRLVSKLKRPVKIQWIHTDYARWCEFSGWSKAVSRHDSLIYEGYSTLVVLSENCKKALVKKIPSVANKVVVIPNMVDGGNILEHAKMSCPIQMENAAVRFVTVARLDQEKRIDKILQIAHEMYKKNVDFKWYIIGDGPLKEVLEDKNRSLDLDEKVVFTGYLENPYPIMRNCDALVLLSKYEGTPVTIDEAMVLGIKVIAPSIGGIPDQIKGYKNCYLLKDDIINLNEFVFIDNYKSIRFDFEEENIRILNLIQSVL